MGHGDPSIRHHDHQIPQAQFEARVPAHAPNNDLSVEVPSSEQIFDRDEPLHLFIIARLPRICTRARGLTWGAIDGTRSMVEVKQGRSQHGELAEPKSARGRRKLDLGPLVKRFVRPDGANPCDLIWPDASYFALQKKLRRVGKQVGIDFPGFGFHTLRRTHATWRDDLRLSSRPDEALVRDMGHADSRTTALYITGTKTGVVERLQNHVYFSGDSRDGRSVN
jgi:integrase